jgi:hypothetical protein
MKSLPEGPRGIQPQYSKALLFLKYLQVVTLSPAYTMKPGFNQSCSSIENPLSVRRGNTL